MTRKLTGLLAASLISAATLLTTACTTSDSSGGGAAAASTSAASLSPQQILPLFLQCLAERNATIWTAAQGNTTVPSVGEKDGWYQNGQVVAGNALSLHGDVIEGFYPISPDFKPQQTIGTWVDDAAQNGTWPKVCAPLR